MITEIDKAYIAGIFDGEGHCAIQKRLSSPKHHRHSYIANVRIVNTNPEVLEFIKSYYGGCIYNRSKPVKSNHRQSYQWYCYGKVLEEFLLDIVPYLRIKKPEVENILAFKQIQPPKKSQGNHVLNLNQEEIDLQKYFYEIDSNIPGRRFRQTRV